MSRMGLVKCKTTVVLKITLNEFADLREQYFNDIETISKMKAIPKEMIINCDQTAVKYVPISDWTKEVRGAKQVHITGKDDKRQLTATLTVTVNGEMLPAQMIYGGKTPACVPSLDFPSRWHITFTQNHWANEDTMLAYIHNILLPYITSTCQKLKCHSQRRSQTQVFAWASTYFALPPQNTMHFPSEEMRRQAKNHNLDHN